MSTESACALLGGVVLGVTGAFVYFLWVWTDGFKNWGGPLG